MLKKIKIDHDLTTRTGRAQFTVIDDLFTRTFEVPDRMYNPSMGLDASFVAITNYALESIYDIYRATKQCALYNMYRLLVLLKEKNETVFDNHRVVNTQFYQKHRSFFEKHVYPNTKANHYYTPLNYNAGTAITNSPHLYYQNYTFTYTPTTTTSTIFIDYPFQYVTTTSVRRP